MDDEDGVDQVIRLRTMASWHLAEAGHASTPEM